MTRYELTERIGAGGMAEIFRGKAVAGGGFEKPVAIKRILPHLSQDEHFVEILIAEANIVSLLRHRNIVQVFDVGMGPDGHYFIVLEFVDGCDLGRLQRGLEVKGKRLPVSLGLHIAAEICDALEYAHRAPGPDGKPLRLVHRDVSPSNVLLSRSGEVKLTDFGIAKRTEEVTSHGGVRGKFAYISPEQGSGRPVDARSDVFSVGILLFEMILGRRLFSGLPDFEALKAVCEGKVPRPRSLDPKLDPKLETILLKALAHDPGDRYPGAGELGKELRSYRYALPSNSGDPAAELSTLVVRLNGRGQSGTGSQAEKKEAGVRRPKPDDFSGGTNTFTLEETNSVVRKTSYAEARQKLDAFGDEETRMVRSFLATATGESEPPADATVLGIPPVPAAFGGAPEAPAFGGAPAAPAFGGAPAAPAFGGAPAAPSFGSEIAAGSPSFGSDAAADSFGSETSDELSQESTRIIDPILRASTPSRSKSAPVTGVPEPMASPGATTRPHQGAPPVSGQSTGQPTGASPALSYPSASAGAGAEAAMAAGRPPDTLDLKGDSARDMSAAVEAAASARGLGSAAMPAAVPAAARSGTPLSSPAATPVAIPATPGSGEISAPVPAPRKPFPRWAVILFVVLFASIILFGVFVGDSKQPAGTTGADAGAAAAASIAAAAPAPDAGPVDAGARATAEGARANATAARRGEGQEAGQKAGQTTGRKARQKAAQSTTRKASQKSVRNRKASQSRRATQKDSRGTGRKATKKKASQKASRKISQKTGRKASQKTRPRRRTRRD